MDKRQFKILNYITAAIVTVIAAVTYLLTIESSASFWDCGEFIASSYKLEVGHPPGNPVFQLFARIFTMPFSGEHVAIAVNSMSALCSAFTIFFLYLTIVFFALRLVRRDENGGMSLSRGIAVCGSAALGALIYTFSDSFWFNAVEGEVYGMSSVFTAFVFWAMTKWYEEAGERFANRWIVLIFFLMGLSIGVHLLNLLTVPAMVFLYYYKMREDRPYSFWQCVGIFFAGVFLLALLFFVIIPWTPKVAAYFDLFFVNTLGLPMNTGAVFFMVAVFTLCFVGMFRTYRKGKVAANTAILCFTTIMIGFSLFSICVIRSNAKTPTNEYQPDNPFTLVRYLNREQYGTTPIIYGQYFDAPATIKATTYWAPLDGKYIKVPGQPDVEYKSEGKMFFPRMWSSSDEHIEFYKAYVTHGKRVNGARSPKPSFADNMSFFFDYQLNFMYWRYFFWNFVGRQNDYHASVPGDVFKGNWESGVKFIDDLRLGDQSEAPSYLKDNKGKNHYYFLPLILGLIGLCWQFDKDKRGCWIIFLMFFMTGLAIVLYLNQPPFQVRERDYAYAGSFYFFSAWAGFAVLAITAALEKVFRSDKSRRAAAAVVSLLCLGVPALMGAQNWDDHDRSGRRTAVEMAYNYLNSVGTNGILITHGDNDTFPLWYAQEVDGVRTDVRICNTSLLGTDWHIDQMKYACNESAPLKLTVPARQYLYGTNEFVYIVDNRNTVLPLSTVMQVFKDPRAKVQLSSGTLVDYIVSRRFSIPVNKENVLKYGILPKEYAGSIPDEIVLEIPKGKEYITKPELFMLDLLSNYNWDRPLNILGMGGDINMGIKEYLMFQGTSYKFVPIKTGCRRSDPGEADGNELYHMVKEKFKFDAVSADDYDIDYQNFYTFCGVMSYRDMFANVARLLNRKGEKDKAVEILDKCQEVMKDNRFPLDMTYLHLGSELSVLQMVEQYYAAGAADKARDLASRFAEELLVSLNFFADFYEYADTEYKSVATYFYYLCDDVMGKNGDKELALKFLNRASDILAKYDTGAEAGE